MKSRETGIVIATACVAAFAAQAFATIVSVNITNTDGSLDVASVESAGVVSATNWNNVDRGNSGGATDLLDADALNSGVDFSYVSGFSNDDAVSSGTPDGRMMSSGINLGTAGDVFTLSDLPSLPAGRVWNLYVYFNGSFGATDPQDRRWSYSATDDTHTTATYFAQNLDGGFNDTYVTSTALVDDPTPNTNTANYIELTDLSGSSISLNIEKINGGDTVVSGFQLVEAIQGPSISVNLATVVTGNAVVTDRNLVDVDETAIDGSDATAAGLAIAGASNVGGADWNNVLLRTDGAPGAPTVFTSATQGGNFIALTDSAGNSDAKLTSTGVFSSAFSGTTDDATAKETIGDAGLMNSYINLIDDATRDETLIVSDLSDEYTGPGYDVYVFFDIGVADRTYGIQLIEGVGGGGLDQIFWTADTLAVDADADEDGLMEWVQALGTTSGTATTDANFAVFRGLTADSFTLTGDSTVGRSIISGFQIVAHSTPVTATIPTPAAMPGALLMLAGLATHRRGRRA